MTFNVTDIQSKLIDGHIQLDSGKDELSLSSNGETLLRFSMFNLTVDDPVDLCNFILQTTKTIEDRFEFDSYDINYCYELIFNDRAKELSHLEVYVTNFPNVISLAYFNYSDHSRSNNKRILFKFESLEQAEQVVKDFIESLD